MRTYLRARLTAMNYARRGLAHFLSTESHARIHLGATLCVIMMAFLLDISSGDCGLLLLATGLVWTAEAFNTAVERIVDLYSSETNELAGQAKDVAAAAVLLAAITAAAVGVLVFVPPAIRFLQT